MDVDLVEVAPGVWQARTDLVGWVLVTEGDEVTLIDTGWPGDRSRVIASLEKVGRAGSDVAAVVLTHAHPDHLGSAEHFRTGLSKPVLVHEAELANATGERVEQVSTATLLRMAWRPDVFVWMLHVVRLDGTRIQRLGGADTFADRQVLDVPGHPSVVHAPGHTSGHCCLHLPDRGVLVAGDALMTKHPVSRRSGPALMPDFFNADPEQARESLSKLAATTGDVVVPGHGPAFSGTPAQAVAIALSASG